VTRTESEAVRRDRDRRMQWWHDARFGMFIHYGLYSLLGRGEWVMYCERIPVDEYQTLTRRCKPEPGSPGRWAALARKAGMKYVVLTAKHHDGFCLWDTRQTDYNAVKRGPGRDLIAEYVQACRKEGLRVGIYYSLLDWHHPDGVRCLRSEPARKRFVRFTQGCVRELMSHYGTIDVLWYDMPYPLKTARAWESHKLNAMVRSLQPDIIINNRSRLDEDFGTPEQRITPEKAGRAWESCMTFTGAWGWRPDPPEDWAGTRDILDMLRKVTAGGGNLLFNIGPKPDGSVPDIAEERLLQVGRWLRGNEEAVYGRVDRVEHNLPNWLTTGFWTLKGNVGYFWCSHAWPGRELVMVDLKRKVRRVPLLKTGKSVRFTQTPTRLILKGLPSRNPDRIAGITVFKVEFAEAPAVIDRPGYVIS